MPFGRSAIRRKHSDSPTAISILPLTALPLPVQRLSTLRFLGKRTLRRALALTQSTISSTSTIVTKQWPMLRWNSAAVLHLGASINTSSSSISVLSLIARVVLVLAHQTALLALAPSRRFTTILALVFATLHLATMRIRLATPPIIASILVPICQVDNIMAITSPKTVY